MTHIVILSRALPIPAMEVGGELIEFRFVDADDPMPAAARVYCSTALDPVDAERIVQLPESVGLIANLGVGTDNVDLEAARSRGIAVSNTPVVTEDTADLAFALVLAACRRIGANERFARAGNWTREAPLAAMGARVHGKTLGIVGFGAIGQAVARRAKGFDLNVIYTGPTRKAEAEAELDATFVASLDDLLAGADIVSLHAPLTPQTRHLLNAERLSRVKRGAVIVNTGRGALIEEAALVEALKSGQIAAAGLDVFEAEPAIHPELLGMEQVALTPHIGSATAECRIDILRRGLANITAFLKTGRPLDQVA